MDKTRKTTIIMNLLKLINEQIMFITTNKLDIKFKKKF